MKDYTITLSQHFIDRARTRMPDGNHLTTSRIKDRVLDAIDFGLKLCDVKNIRYKQYLIGLQKKYRYGSDIRILDGFVYVFNAFESIAITIYPVPDYASYERNYS